VPLREPGWPARLAGAIRHPITLLRIANWRLGGDPARLAAVITRFLPPNVIRIVSSRSLQRLAKPLPSVAFLLLDRAGYRERAAVVAQAHYRSERVRRRLAALASALDHPIGVDTTSAAAAPTSAPDARLAIHEASKAARSGEITRAIALLRPFQRRNDVVRLLARYEGELAIYSEGTIRPGARVAIKPNRHRVLHCVTNALPYTRSGYTLRTHKIAQAQRAAGLDPHVVTSWGWPVLQGFLAAAPAAELEGVTYHRLLPGRGRLPETAVEMLGRAADSVTQLAQQLRPSVLHAASGHRNGTVALAVRDRTGLPVIYEVRGFHEESRAARLRGPGGDEQYSLQRRRDTAIMQEADAIVTLAGTMRDEIAARGVDRDKIVLVPNAVDSALLHTRFDGPAFRARYGIGAHQFVVGSVSSLTAYEGFSTLLDAISILRDEAVSVRLLLVGDGADLPALIAQVEKLDIGDLAVLPGRVSHTEALVACSALDAFIVPRRDVTVTRLVTPLKPVEAMAIGVPVIASDLPALAELLGNGSAGMLVPSEDPRKLAEVINRMRQDPQLRSDLASAGRAEIARHRTWERVVEAYRVLYERVGAM
jgi:glycosyltransferase involved in cell wall biosynthesis